MSQQVGTRTICVLAADFPRTASTVLTNVTGMSFPAVANGKYLVRMSLPFSLAGVAPGFKFQVTVPAAGTSFMQRTFVVADDATITLESVIVASASIGNTLANAGNHTIEVFMYIENGATAGTVQLQWAQNVSDAAATTILKGAIMDIVQVS